MYPLAKVEEYAVITPNLAEQFKNGVYTAQSAQIATFWILTGAFIVFCVLGAVLIVFAQVKK